MSKYVPVKSGHLVSVSYIVHAYLRVLVYYLGCSGAYHKLPDRAHAILLKVFRGAVVLRQRELLFSLDAAWIHITFVSNQSNAVATRQGC